MEAKSSVPDLHFAFDVGHSSIGWAVLKTEKPWPAAPDVLGTGVVTFAADDCLASKRRQLRRARRHIRSTRQRIRRMERLLEHLGFLTKSELSARHRQGGGDGFSWRKAAEILRCLRQGRPVPPTRWLELWDMLRWYAHNRGYDGNARWARSGEEQSEDTEKEEKARGIMAELGTASMAESIEAYTFRYEQHAAAWRAGTRSDKPVHFKGLGAAFPRAVVAHEVRLILTGLEGRLPGLDAAFRRALLGEGPADREAWKAVLVPGLVLPKRYEGGLLFGQLVPRFDNRIIGQCPIWYARREAEFRAAGFSEDEARHRAEVESKLPLKSSVEFLRFRWAMQLANLFGARQDEAETRPLTGDERRKLTAIAEQQGGFTAGEFKKAVRGLTGWGRDNLDQTLLHPDADRALVLDPAQRCIVKSLGSLWSGIPDRIQKRIHGRLVRGHGVKIGTILEWLGPSPAFETWIEARVSGVNTRKGRGKVGESITRDMVLAEVLRVEAKDAPSGRAPHARPILRLAVNEVLDPPNSHRPRHPREKGGCLEQTEELREAQLSRRLVEQTNNHLVRHRLLILERLLEELVSSAEFASGKKQRVASLTIEVNRDLRELSGRTAKEIAQDLGLRLGDFNRVAAKVEEACMRRGVPVTAGLIRKARIAEDLGWTCPYTSVQFCLDDLIEGRVDKDHIIPHADRQSDSLDSLVITFSEVNRMKGRRTALQFVTEDGGKGVEGSGGMARSVAVPRLSIQSVESFKRFVETLEMRKGHDDDKARKRRRKDRLLIAAFEEKEFTPRDLTVTSHLVRLGAQVLERHFVDVPRSARPRIYSLPGSVTGEIRKAWDLLGCLVTAAPSTQGKTKSEIRGITHLHHALDACVLGLASWYFPAHGTTWAAMIKAGSTDRAANSEHPLWRAMVQRRPSALEAAILRSTGLYQSDGEGRWRLSKLEDSLKDQIRRRLAEKRVVQHLPSDMSGLRIEENTRRVVRIEGERVVLRQVAPRDGKTGIRKPSKETDERPEKLLGLAPPHENGKLQRQKGVRVIDANFGVAILDHAASDEERFTIIPWHRVWHRLELLRSKNGNRRPVLIRNGDLIRIRIGKFAGTWRVFSAKNNASGMALDIGSADVVRLENKTQGHKINVLLGSLVKGGLEVLPHLLTGAPLRAEE